MAIKYAGDWMGCLMMILDQHLCRVSSLEVSKCCMKGEYEERQ